jgi:hypothetical protein
MYKVEKCGTVPEDFYGDRTIETRHSLMQTRVVHQNHDTHDAFKVIHCGDLLNFVLVTKLVESRTEFAPPGKILEGVRCELVVVYEFQCDEIPGQYWGFAQRTIAHLHFLCGWLLTDVPNHRNEAMYLRHWLMAAIDGLTAECRSVFPPSARGRRRYPATWRSQVLGGCTS